MSCCVKILYNGEYLDTDAGLEDYGINRVLTELTELNEMKFDYNLSISLPDTPKNSRILGRFFEPSALESGESFDITIELNGKVEEFLMAYPSKYDDGYELDLVLNEKHWGVFFRDTFVKDTNLADIDFSQLQTTNQTNYPHNNSPYYFPYVDFGQWEQDFTNPTKSVVMPHTYFRPYVYVRPLLEQMFCDAGYKLDFPFLDTQFGRELAVYLLRKDYGTGEEWQDEITNGYREATKEVVSSTPLSNSSAGAAFFPLPFVKAGTFNADSSITENAIVSVKGYAQVLAYAGGANYDKVKLGIGQFTDVPNIQLAGLTIRSFFHKCYAATQLNGQSGNNIFEFDVNGIPLNELDKFGIIYYDYLTSTPIYAGLAELKVTIERVLWGSNSIIPFSKYCAQSLTKLDLLKALTHVLNLKFETNLVEKIVTVRSAYDADVFGNANEGFFTDNIVKLDLECGSEKIDHKRDFERYVKLKYKDSGNEYIEGFDNSLWEGTFDRGSNYENDTVERENILFPAILNGSAHAFTNYSLADSPTFRDKTIKIYNSRLWYATANSVSFVEEIKEHEIQNITFDIEPHLVLIKGLREQEGLPLIRYTKDYINDQATTLIPSTYAVPRIRYGDTHNLAGAPLKWFTENLAFGINAEYNQTLIPLSKYVWARYLLENRMPEISVLVNLKYYELVNLSFRDTYQIEYKGKPINARLLEINDIKACKDLPTELVFAQIPRPCVDYSNDFFQIGALRKYTYGLNTKTNKLTTAINFDDTTGFGIFDNTTDPTGIFEYIGYAETEHRTPTNLYITQQTFAWGFAFTNADSLPIGWYTFKYKAPFPVTDARYREVTFKVPIVQHYNLLYGATINNPTGVRVLTNDYTLESINPLLGVSIELTGNIIQSPYFDDKGNTDLLDDEFDADAANAALQTYDIRALYKYKPFIPTGYNRAAILFDLGLTLRYLKL